MDKFQLQDIIDKIETDSHKLQSKFLQENNHSFSSIFNNTQTDETLGELMYQTIKNVVMISKHSWDMDREDFKDWIDEVFNEIENN